MGIKINWDNKSKNIIRCEFKGKWTLSEFEAAAEKFITMIQSEKHRIDLILDLTKSNGIVPDGIIVKFRQMMLCMPDNAGQVVLVSKRYDVATMVRLYNRTFKSSLKQPLFVSKMNDAYNQLIQSNVVPEHVDGLEAEMLLEAQFAV